MNSAQRRAKERLVKIAMAEAKFDGLKANLDRREREIHINEDNSRKQLARDKKIFEDWCNQERVKLDAARASLNEERDELTKLVEVHKEGMQQERRQFQEQASQLENVSVVRDVLLELECGLDPVEIATNIRTKLQLLIPTW